MKSMLRKLLARNQPKYRAPDGARVYAVGDVHGCKEQLIELLGVIEQHAARFDGPWHLVFLGDLVDRGPDSAGVLEHLDQKEFPTDRVTFLKGNHEEIMLDCYDGRTDLYAPWLRFGGLETMASYGISREAIFAKDFDLSEAMQAVIPPSHIELMRSAPDTLRFGDYLFVHAGIRPGRALEDQDPRDLRWITSDFLDDRTDHGFMVVHGHTIVPSVTKRSNRIAVDTGCYRSGVLSAVMLEGESAFVIATKPKSAPSAV